MTKISNTLDFAKLKANGQKFSVVTCYDYTSALIVSNSLVDVILVGDSVAMTMHGQKSTIFANVKELAMHTQWVIRGLGNEKPKFVVCDMPFLSISSSLENNINSVHEIMLSGANAIKIEGADGNIDFIKHIVKNGVPVMGHLGLLPQNVNVIGGYKVQGREDEQAEKILNDAIALEQAGCFAIVLECVPTKLAKKITDSIKIPTIGIGAGNVCDAQVLVWQDLLGLNKQFKPKFVRQFADGAQIFTHALNQYHNCVLDSSFPNDDESFS